MKLLYITVLVCFFVASVTASTEIGFFTDPAHPGKCVVDGKILSPGDIAQFSFGCGRMICGEEGEVTFQRCGVEVPPPGYTLGEPLYPTADYPDCCKRPYIPIV